MRHERLSRKPRDFYSLLVFHTQERAMIISILTYKLPNRWTLEQAVAMFKTTAPLYLGKRGLVRKHYVFTEAADVKGVYLWKSNADAEGSFTPDWKGAIA